MGLRTDRAGADRGLHPDLFLPVVSLKNSGMPPSGMPTHQS